MLLQKMSDMIWHVDIPSLDRIFICNDKADRNTRYISVHLEMSTFAGFKCFKEHELPDEWRLHA